MPSGEERARRAIGVISDLAPDLCHHVLSPSEERSERRKHGDILLSTPPQAARASKVSLLLSASVVPRLLLKPNYAGLPLLFNHT